MLLSRRALLQAGAATAAVTLMRCSSPISVDGGRLAEMPAGGTLTAAERPLQLPGKTGLTHAWLYRDTPFPVLRAKTGETLSITLANGLKEHSSIHWHGVRLPNAMDGVPYLTQLPVQPGQTFDYRFLADDPGFFIFHPHCNTIEQFGRGLVGVLIVEDGKSDFDDDVVCVLKDWRVADDGSFLPLLTAQGAGGAGDFGTLRTANGRAAPDIAVAAGANIRIRIASVDATRIADLGVMGADAYVIAVDGRGVEPFRLDTWRLGPAMRVELALRTPSAGSVVTLVDYFAADPVTLATFTASGAAKRTDAFVPARLPLLLPEPDVANAEAHALLLGQSALATEYAAPPIVLPDGRTIDLLDSLCSTSRTFWALDGKTWPQSGHQSPPPPLMRFKRGQTALIEFFNSTRQAHPMHLHGHAFKVLSASKLARPVHWADTVLVMPDERVRIAFVADNPGNWMVHCHIIEHQDTGMMGWFEVT